MDQYEPRHKGGDISQISEKKTTPRPRIKRTEKYSKIYEKIKEEQQSDLAKTLPDASKQKGQEEKPSPKEESLPAEEPSEENKQEKVEEMLSEGQKEALFRRKGHRTIIYASLLFSLICLVFFLFSKGMDNSTQNTIERDVSSESKEIQNPMLSDIRTKWQENKEINPDYVGQIVFDSGLVDLAIVQASDVYQSDGTLYEFYTQDGDLVVDPEGHSGNDVYIWSDWKTHKYDGYGKDGAVFFDYRNTISDQNLIIYGHHIARDFDPEGNSEFTPLDVFLKKEGYEENKTLRLILNNEIREYEVVRIFTIDATNYDEIQILRTEFDKDLSGEDDPEFFGRYLEFINSRQKYDTGIEIGADERFLTLITCSQHQPVYRQIVLCRETNAKQYDG